MSASRANRNGAATSARAAKRAPSEPPQEAAPPRRLPRHPALLATSGAFLLLWLLALAWLAWHG